jgi:hypothetical protein
VRSAGGVGHARWRETGECGREGVDTAPDRRVLVTVIPTAIDDEVLDVRDAEPDAPLLSAGFPRLERGDE